MGCSDPFRDRPTSFEVLAPNAIKSLRSYLGIPNPIGINHQPRAIGAHAQASRLGPHDGQVVLFHRRFEMFPGGEACLNRTTVGPHAKKQVSARGRQTYLRKIGSVIGVHSLRHRRATELMLTPSVSPDGSCPPATNSPRSKTPSRSQPCGSDNEGSKRAPTHRGQGAAWLRSLAASPGWRWR